MNWLFHSDIVKLLVKTNGGSDRRPNFVIFVVWSVRIVGLEQKFLLRAALNLIVCVPVSVQG